MNPKTIGETLKEARKRRHLTQDELAKMHGMSRATISGIERNTLREVGLRKVERIAMSLGLRLTLVPKRPRPTLEELRNEQRNHRRSR